VLYGIFKIDATILLKNRIAIDPVLKADAIVSPVFGQYEACAENEGIKQRRPHTD